MISYKDVPGFFDFEDIYIDAVDKAPEGSTLIEVGSFLGRSAIFMAQQIKKTGKNLKFYVVDDWNPEYFAKCGKYLKMGFRKSGYEVFLDYIHAAGVADVINIIRETSPKVSRYFEDKSIFFAFIDGDHKYETVKKDCKAWEKKIVPYGILAGHDYPRESVKNAVRETLSHHVPVYRSWVHCPDSNFYTLSERATLQHALKHNSSLIRMGTGEIKYLFGKGHAYNDDPRHREDISKTFRNLLSQTGIIHKDHQRDGKKAFLTTLPRFWEPYDRFADRWHQDFLKNYFSKFNSIEKFLNPNTFYGSMFFSRLDMAPQLPYFWDMAKKLWKKKDVITVTEEHLSLTEFGDLFDEASIVEEIKVPPKNAYSELKRVKKQVNKHSKKTLILCSCGFLAGCLCFELTFDRYQALDVSRIGRGYLTST